MAPQISPNDLIRYIYHETTPQENLLIEEALLSDEATAKLFHELMETVTALDTVKKNPGKKTIDNILNYSRSYKKKT